MVETAAVLEWLLNVSPKVKVAVLDVDPCDVTFKSVFKALYRLYGIALGSDPGTVRRGARGSDQDKVRK